jgi:hypothetical protein
LVHLALAKQWCKLGDGVGPGDFTGTLEGKNRSLRSTSAHPALFYPAYARAAGIRGPGARGASDIGGEERPS